MALLGDGQKFSTSSSRAALNLSHFVSMSPTSNRSRFWRWSWRLIPSKSPFHMLRCLTHYVSHVINCVPVVGPCLDITVASLRHKRVACAECCTRQLCKQRDNIFASNDASCQEVVMSFKLTLGSLKSTIRSRFFVCITPWIFFYEKDI